MNIEEAKMHYNVIWDEEEERERLIEEGIIEKEEGITAEEMKILVL